VSTKFSECSGISRCMTKRGRANLHCLKVSWLYLRINHGQGKI
jgi:hypothetical protein